jgi:type IV secretion system protein VirB11
MTPARDAIDSSLQHYSRPLAALLDDPEVTELCLQRPGELHVERGGGWTLVGAPWATETWSRHFARLVATATSQRIGPDAPLLSASLPTGERIQVVLPPAAGPEGVAFAIRRPSASVWTLAALEAQGVLDVRPGATGARQVQDGLAEAYGAGNLAAFLRAAVRTRRNILVAGATGSGKTTLTKALIEEIDRDERLISIEDAAELDLGRHRNSVRLFYSKADQGRARVAPKQLLEASLRLRPDRILLAELRGEEAYYYLRNVSSGHPGSITSIHAGSAALAFEQLAMLVRESDAGRDLPLADIHRLSRAVIDIVVCCERQGGRRVVTDVWWRDAPSPGASGGR